MADIAKALDVLAREGVPRKATWVQGIPAMREVVVDEYAARATVTQRFWLRNATELPDLLAQSHDPKERTLIVVRGAQSLTDALAPLLLRWVTSRTLGTHALFVAEQDTWPRVGYGRDAPYANPALRDVFANPRRSTLLVEGLLPDTVIGRTHAADVARHLSGCDRSEATHIAQACGYDLTRIREVSAKCKALGSFSQRAVNALSAHEAPTGYVDALIGCDAATAALTARHVPATALPGIITRLDTALTVLSRVHATVKDGDSTHALASRLGVNRVVVDRYRPYAKHYGGANVAKRTDALVWASEQVGRGRSTGVLEVLAVLWG